MQKNPLPTQLSNLIDSPVKILILLLLLIFGWGLRWGLEKYNEGYVEPKPVLPEQKQACVAGAGQSWDCSDVPGVDQMITFENVPVGITPYVIPVNPGDMEKGLSGGCLVSISGNIIFGDGKNNLITKFNTPISMTLSYDPQDLADANVRCSTNYEEADLVPVALVSTFGGETAWVRYPGEYTIDYETHATIITFTAWGDQPTGWGTPPK